MGMQLALLDNEQWWGGLTDDGIRMPFGAGPEGLPVSRNLAESLNGNQGVPLLISNKGRYVWSEQLYIDGDGDSLKLGEGFGDLRGVYREVSGRYFKASGTMPDRLLFTAPQYNTWIEMLYEPTQIKVLRYADSILEQGLAPGVLMIDDNWMELYGDWRFHTGRFPDPQAMIEELHRKGSGSCRTFRRTASCTASCAKAACC
jgi:hypothetical protein